MSTPAIIYCPLCNDAVDKLLYRFHFETEREALKRIRDEHPAWSEQDGICSRCLDYFQSEVIMQQKMLPEIGPHFPIKTADDFIVLPTGLRADVHPGYTGRGVTICFIDSGFFLHPDLTAHRNRIKKIADITNPSRTTEFFQQPHPSQAHGTMTSVVCAGDGFLSNGLYKGIACDAELVLLKVQDDAGKISTAALVKALQWVLDHHRTYDIRIVNLSVYADEIISWKESEVDQLAEQLIQQGVVVVAAAGNDKAGMIRPPANSPHVITVGGIDDENRIGQAEKKLYHSSHGPTIDALMKPELLAPAMWIAAPIPPGNLAQQEPKAISAHYMHVEGSSFAAPIVCGIIAQLLEANPRLGAHDVRAILLSTAKRMDIYPAARQGFGVVQPRAALLQVLKRNEYMLPGSSPLINRDANTIEFSLYYDQAEQIALAGSFNNWAQGVLLMEPSRNGIWKIAIPLLPAGRYTYKFFADDKKWVEDVNNPYREPDGFNGFNSILIVEP